VAVSGLSLKRCAAAARLSSGSLAGLRSGPSSHRLIDVSFDISRSFLPSFLPHLLEISKVFLFALL